MAGQASQQQQQPSMRLQLLLLSVVSSVLLSCRTCQAELIGRPACVDLRGYETMPGVVPIFTSSYSKVPQMASDGLQLSSVDAAMAACSANPSCIAFSSYGITANLGRLMSWDGDVQSCTYIKRVFSKKDGYRLQLYSKMVGNNIFSAGSATAAEAKCGSTPGCAAWSTDGKYALAPVSFYPSAIKMASYQKIGCADKFGYVTHGGVKLVQVDGDLGSIAGQNPNVTEAELFCKLQYACTAFSSDGRYLLGGVSDYQAETGTCSWVKEPCAPNRGFTAYNDVAYKDKSGLLARPSVDCFANVYTECLANPNCRSFNNMRYMFGANQPPVSEATVESAPGMCIYVKI